MQSGHTETLVIEGTGGDLSHHMQAWNPGNSSFMEENTY